ncbi:hypothetical protein WBP06_22075 [Novosphingobium sp. BL-8H]|uniref:tetratricopeptide repeat protein n=1 Tax=Novosphingobium sp. BL-8H TaxID=3127640 RepID=UPI003757F665
MREVRSLIAALSLLALAPVAAHAADAARAADTDSADPGIARIHALAAGGHVDQALTLMNRVLKDHPNSAKAHYVEAELYARDSKMALGRSELAKAEQISPGLPFADVYSVAELNRQLSLGPSSVQGQSGAVAPASAPHVPWGPIAVLAGLAGVAFMLFRRRSTPAVQPMAQSPWAPSGYAPQGGMGVGGVGAGGIGSGLLGNLASGAAMGAGFAAGEEVIDRMFGGGERREARPADTGFGSDLGGGNEDMGGNDFGITDDGSWDDNSTDGGGW